MVAGDCNATLFRNVPLLKSLPTAELAKYLGRCWNSGGAMMYVQTSMYSVCVLHALRHFPREQVRPSHSVTHVHLLPRSSHAHLSFESPMCILCTLRPHPPSFCS